MGCQKCAHNISGSNYGTLAGFCLDANEHSSSKKKAKVYRDYLNDCQLVKIVYCHKLKKKSMLMTQGLKFLLELNEMYNTGNRTNSETPRVSTVPRCGQYRI